MIITEAQREIIKQVRIKQAIEHLNQISERQTGLINGNFTAIAYKYGLKVKELRNAYKNSK